MEYIRPYNRRKAVRIADDKLFTKSVLELEDIPVPRTIKSISTFRELDSLQEEDLPKSFVIKPVHGIEGGGIDIFFNKKNGKWIRGDRSKSDLNQIKQHMRDILEGRYSLFNQPDVVMLEERVKPHKAFKQYTYKGATPDVRVIVFNRVPVMAMLRLPTAESQGKANMALGAIGAAIDIGSGKLTTAVKGKKGTIEYIPHNNIRIAGMQVPHWDTILKLAVKSQNISGLGWASVDFLIDREDGPRVVELNARTGLSIQLADQEGMRSRLEKIKGVKVKSSKHGIRLGRELFGGEIEMNIEQLTGRQVIGIIENIKITGPEGISDQTKAKIDTGADSTSIDRKILERIGFADTLYRYDELVNEVHDEGKFLQMDAEEVDRYTEWIMEQVREREIIGIEKVVPVKSSHGRSMRPYFTIKLTLAGVTFDTYCSAYDRSKLKYSVIVGKKSLEKVLIDVSK